MVRVGFCQDSTSPLRYSLVVNTNDLDDSSLTIRHEICEDRKASICDPTDGTVLELVVEVLKTGNTIHFGNQ